MEILDELLLSKTMATRELSAFFTAVTELFGPVEAKAAAEDWLRELTVSKGLPASACEWRTLTITAAAKLASRVDASEYQQQRLASSNKSGLR